MGGDRFHDGVIPLPDIPDEGLEGSWSFSPALFAEEPEPINLTSAAAFVGRLDRMDDTVTLTGEVTAELDLQCSRCLCAFVFGLHGPLTAVFLPESAVQDDIGGERELRGEELDERSYRGETVELFGAIHDHIALAAPLRPLCDEECKGLCQSCGTDLNEGECDCAPGGEGNPFAKLKNLTTD